MPPLEGRSPQILLESELSLHFALGDGWSSERGRGGTEVSLEASSKESFL